MKLLKTLLAGVLILGMSGCDAFLDVNVDPNAATEVDPGLLFTYAVVANAAHRAMEGGQHHMYHSQIWGSNAVYSWWWEWEHGRPIGPSINNVWLDSYVDGHKNLLLASETAMEAGRPNMAAQAQLYMQHIFYELTTTWERVPFTQALQPVEFPEPEFDDQRTILYGIIDRVDEALALINTNDPFVIGRQDPIFGERAAIGGPASPAAQMQRWERFGNSLKLMAYTLLRGGGENVEAQIAALLSQPLIDAASFNAVVPFDANSVNPLFRFTQTSGWFNASGLFRFWPGAPLVAIMNDYEDPRRPVYMQPNAAGEFAAAAPGFAIRPQENASRMNENYIRAARPDPLITADEVHFMIAEHHVHMNNLAAANTSYRAGVRAAFDALPVMANTSVPAASRDAFIASLPDLTTLSPADALLAIHRQHYVALYGRGFEAWILTRRVGERELGLTMAPGYNSELSNFLTRWFYPTSEITTNPNTPLDPPLDRPQWFMSQAVR